MKIIVYGKQNCPWCVRAVEWLRDRGLTFTYIDVLQDLSVGELLNIKMKYEMNTAPIVVIDNKLIGGFSDLEKLTIERETT